MGNGDMRRSSKARQSVPTKAAGVAPESPKGKRHRIADGLIALSTAAIVSVYTLGYIHTSAAEEQISAQELTPAATATTAPRPSETPAPARPTATARGAPAPTATPPTARGAPASTATPPSASQSSAQSPAGYRDGTYVGVGTSRHGNIEATIVIKGGKISSAAISRCGTRYSCSVINALVSEVVTRQAVPVDHISRATDSSNAYKQAVTNALANAV